MNIYEYNCKFFDGNKAAFARAFNRLPQNVSKMFNDPNQWMVVITEKKHLLVQIRGVQLID